MLTRYIARRVLIFPLQLIAISVIVFFVMRALPADPVARLVGVDATPQAMALVRDQLDLDKPVTDQLLIYLGLESGNTGPGIINGSLGKSWNSGQTVADEIHQYLPVTLELISYAFLLALAISIPLGLASALNPGGRIDRVITGYGLFAGAQPEFWWGLAFIFVFYVTLHIAPAPLGRIDFLTKPPPTVTGMLTVDSLISGNWPALIDSARHLVLPVITLAFVLSGPITKMVRQNVLKTVQSDFILYAESCGLPTRRIAGYTFKNSLAPCLTLIGILFAYMLSGAVLVEQVFSLSGLGSYAVKSVLSFDFPAIQGIVLVITVLTLLILLVLDVAHAVIDPADRALMTAIAGRVDLGGPPTPYERARLAARVAGHQKLLMFGIGIVVVSMVLAVIGPWIAPYNPVLPTGHPSVPPPSLFAVPGLILDTITGRLAQPVFWFGTDSTGLDVFSRVISAPQVDVVIGLSATAISLALGTLLGLTAGFFQTRAAQSIIRVSDVFQSFPIFILAMILVALTGRSVWTIIVTLGLLYTPIYLRLVCVEVVSQSTRRHVEAARAIGNTELAVAFRHVLPNSMTPALIQASVTIGWAILFTAGLTFLGAGVRPPTAEWGGMIAAGANQIILGEWWPSVFPGIAISICVLGYAIVGNALEARFRG